MEAIKKYNDDILVNEIIERELWDILPKKRRPKFGFFDTNLQEEYVDLSVPELKLSKRFYKVPIDSSRQYPVSITDFDRFKQDFFNGLETTQKITMIWAIGYSRLDSVIQTSLLTKYYCNETYYSMYKVSKRTKNTELLKWLLENQ